jgi:hypothetical protein
MVDSSLKHVSKGIMYLHLLNMGIIQLLVLRVRQQL